MLKSLADDIVNMMGSLESMLFILEVIEELPYELRPDLFEGLASFSGPEMALFFQLLDREYGKDMQGVVQHALHKYALAGFNVNNFPEPKGDFYRAYVSKTRHTGRVTLDIGWKQRRYDLRVESFSLSFNADGLNSFLVIESVDSRDFDRDHAVLQDISTIDYDECCLLIRDAFAFNRRHMTRPALGRFVYQRYLEGPDSSGNAGLRRLIRRVSQDLSPRQVVNSFFYALKQQDSSFLSALMDEQYLVHGDLFFGANTALSPGAFLIEAGIESVGGSRRRLEVAAHALFVNERDVTRSQYHFLLAMDTGGFWAIKDIDRTATRSIGADDPENPFNVRVYCYVYDIIDMDELFEMLDGLENIREVEEIPYGLHIRVNYLQDPGSGISFLNGVAADLVLNGDEFVIISRDEQVMEEYDGDIAGSLSRVLKSKGQYQLNLSHAYSYLTGQFAAFEDLARTEAGELMLEEGLRFISARYWVKDRAAALEWLEANTQRRYELVDDIGLYYQLDKGEEAHFSTEYLLGNKWLTVSAFGERDLALARRQFEGQLLDTLEFQGLELRENGLLAVLDPETRRRYPALEGLVKGLYLARWYESRNPSLKGLSPSEASKTEEGTRLLWTMFKKMRQAEKRKLMHRHNYRISLNEYIHKVEEKNQAKSGRFS